MVMQQTASFTHISKASLLQASSQAGDWMSAMGRSVHQTPTHSPVPHGANPPHYSLHQPAQPSASSSSPNPHAVGSLYNPNNTYLAQTQVYWAHITNKPCLAFL